MPTIPVSHRPHRWRGAAMVESVAGLAIVLTVGVLTIETAHWLLARQLVTLALLEAARAGATTRAQPQAMVRAFERALIPLLASGRGTSDQALLHLQATLADRSVRAGLPTWRIHIASPRAAHFDDFAVTVPRGAGAAGSSAVGSGTPDAGAIGAGAAASNGAGAGLSHDYQYEQHQRHRQRWPQGRGPRSGQDIFAANQLSLRLRYLHQPLTPLLSALLRALGRGLADNDNSLALRQGLLPIASQVAVTMQSSARRWPGWRNAGGAVTSE